jgi:hypothetical protein
MANYENAVLHVRYAGRSFDVPFATLDIGAAADDRQIKRALAAHLDVRAEKFDDYVIDRHTNGSMTVRPGAVFG